MMAYRMRRSNLREIYEHLEAKMEESHMRMVLEKKKQLLGNLTHIVFVVETAEE
jgi:DNA polymerase III alpha subunit (gram-positive type)